MVVAQALGVCLRTGGVAELNIGELLGSLDHVVLMTEGIGKNDVAAGVCQLAGGIVALLALGDVGAEQVLIFGQAQGSNGFLSAVHEVQVISGVFVMQEDEAQLHIADRSGSLGLRSSSLAFSGRGSSGCCRSLGLATASSQTQDHNKNQCQRKNLFHLSFFLLEKIMCKLPKQSTAKRNGLTCGR